MTTAKILNSNPTSLETGLPAKAECIVCRLGASDEAFGAHVEVLRTYRDQVVLGSQHRAYVERYYKSLSRWNAALDSLVNSAAAEKQAIALLTEVSVAAQANDLTSAVAAYAKFEDYMNSI